VSSFHIPVSPILVTRSRVDRHEKTSPIVFYRTETVRFRIQVVSDRRHSLSLFNRVVQRETLLSGNVVSSLRQTFEHILIRRQTEGREHSKNDSE
jgi:DNA mismatch repair ATPase MutS